MKIQKYSKATGGFYHTVLVDAGELVTASGKTLPYSTWIGVIESDGSIDVWSPSASVPRGYRDAAMAMLVKARTQIQKEENDAKAES